LPPSDYLRAIIASANRWIIKPLTSTDKQVFWAIHAFKSDILRQQVEWIFEIGVGEPDKRSPFI
jgi:hypothetical protein